VVEFVDAAARHHVCHAAVAGGKRGIYPSAIATQPDVGARRAKGLKAPGYVADPGSLAPLGDQGHPLLQNGIHCGVELAAVGGEVREVGPLFLLGSLRGEGGAGETSVGA
jgi:hypothetical protein